MACVVKPILTYWLIANKAKSSGRFSASMTLSLFWLRLASAIRPSRIIWALMPPAVSYSIFTFTINWCWVSNLLRTIVFRWRHNSLILLNSDME